MHGPALLVRIQSFKSEFVYVANTYYVCTYNPFPRNFGRSEIRLRTVSRKPSVIGFSALSVTVCILKKKNPIRPFSELLWSDVRCWSRAGLNSLIGFSSDSLVFCQQQSNSLVKKIELLPSHFCHKQYQGIAHSCAFKKSDISNYFCVKK